MSDRIITAMYLSDQRAEAVSALRAVIDGKSECVEMEGVDRVSGAPVTVRIYHS